jgi:hypothetical protein
MTDFGAKPSFHWTGSVTQLGGEPSSGRQRPLIQTKPLGRVIPIVLEFNSPVSSSGKAEDPWLPLVQQRKIGHHEGKKSQAGGS